MGEILRKVVDRSGTYSGRSRSYFFDTADTYGLGQSEKTLGKALGSHRKDVVIASKFGVRIENGQPFMIIVHHG